ncbi:hypothetical protein BHE74_00000471 [Ensete ventricosum]|nr:hypothetical protein BHE74_00000471 [Ensete ventricosum]
MVGPTDDLFANAAWIASHLSMLHGWRDGAMTCPEQMPLLRPPPPRILLDNVSCTRDARTVLRNINGSTLVLAGANGFGKTAFLRLLAGFSRPSCGFYVATMAPAVERREHKRRVSSDRSTSPVRDRRSPRRRISPRRERSPAPRKSSPRARSPARTNRARSPVKENAHDRARSPKRERQHSPVKGSAPRSPSPRTKRLKRAHAEREPEKLADRELRRHSGREDHDKGRYRERGEIDDISRHSKSSREKNDSVPSKSSRRDHSDSPEGRSRRSRYSSRSPTRPPKAGARDEVSGDIFSLFFNFVGIKPKTDEYDWGDESDSVAKMKAAEQALEAKEKQKPSFELSGKLAEETNRVRAINPSIAFAFVADIFYRYLRCRCNGPWLPLLSTDRFDGLVVVRSFLLSPLQLSCAAPSIVEGEDRNFLRHRQTPLKLSPPTTLLSVAFVVVVVCSFLHCRCRRPKVPVSMTFSPPLNNSFLPIRKFHCQSVSLHSGEHLGKRLEHFGILAFFGT